MKEQAKAMVMASFIADSHALGAHWIYDTSLIDKQFGRVESLLAPLKDSYHPTKGRGELTHYGDQTLLLLNTLVADSGFKLESFSKNWHAFFEDYQGYRDKATRETLENFKAGKGIRDSGSSSTDLAGAARIAPLVYRYQEDPGKLVEVCRDQTALTHNHPDVIDSAEFLARVTLKVLDQISPKEAIEAVTRENFNKPPFNKWVADGLKSVDTETRAAIAGFGQMCGVQAAFPSVIHLLSRYPDNLKEALVQNVMAGGDSAARGMAVGMVLGAYLGMEAIPTDWLSTFKHREAITQALARLG